MSRTRTPLLAGLCCVALVTSRPDEAAAHAAGVGLGVAGGVAYSPTELDAPGIPERTPGTSFAWGFFVDIPLLATFYVAPAAMLYELDLGAGKEPVTDVDINFKFIVPVSSLKLGAGFTVGLTNAERQYAGHWGGLGYLAIALVDNFDVFAMAQYKKLMRDDAQSVDHIHGFAGGMFYF